MAGLSDETPLPFESTAPEPIDGAAHGLSKSPGRFLLIAVLGALAWLPFIGLALALR